MEFEALTTHVQGKDRCWPILGQNQYLIGEFLSSKKTGQ